MTGIRGFSGEIDLDAYLARIDYHGPLTVTHETLRELHRAHATHIPFENIDVLLGRPIRLDLAGLQAKLVGARRGGYCFEHNLLFAAALERLGFQITGLAARVRLGGQTQRARTHMLLRVTIGDEDWVADVGFGGAGLLEPMPLNGGEAQQAAWRFRIIDDNAVRVLQALRADGWLDLYAFTLDAQYFADYVMANHYTSTWPESPFVNRLVVQLTQPDVRWSLVDHELTLMRPDDNTTTLLKDPDVVIATLRNRFGIELPTSTSIPHLHRM
ncbi:MAG: arylamine N-acetyltransferase family protein [Burkholderiales bacterium]